MCPVKGPVRIGQGWGAPRDGGRRRHQGIDLLAPAGTPLVAVTSGTITRLSNADRGRGGISLWLRDARGTAYYYAHNQHNLVRLGQRVRRVSTFLRQISWGITVSSWWPPSAG